MYNRESLGVNALADMLDFSILDKVIKETTKAIEASKESLFEIAESAKDVHRKMESDLERVNHEVQQVIEKVDQLEALYKKARVRLMEVSRDFKKYSEQDIKAAYLYAQELQVQLAVEREREMGLRLKRDELVRSMVRVKEMSVKADELVSRVDMALTLISGNLTEFSHQLEGMQQKQWIGGRIILAQEEERKRVAREIHDGPAQTLANVVLRAEYCEKLLATNRSELAGQLHQLKTTVRESLQDIRRIIFNLRPITLDDMGLIPTVRRYIEELKLREGIDVFFEVRGEELRLKNPYEVALFRLIQEGLNNAKKHARATRIGVSIIITGDEIKVTISDNGSGFDVEKVLAEAAGKESFGLLSMKERIELLNGELKIDSTPGFGTRIVVLVPREQAVL